MGLLTLTQIPCHHVLANEIALNLKYRIGLKHFFNINLGIGIIKKLLFLFVFSTYLSVFLLKFRSGELKYFLFWGQRGTSKVCQVGTRWMRNLIPHTTSSSDKNLSENIGRYVKNTNKKKFFSFLPSKLINIIIINFFQEAHFEVKFPLMSIYFFLIWLYYVCLDMWLFVFQ